MRAYVVFVLLLAMLGGSVYAVVARPRTPHVPPHVPGLVAHAAVAPAGASGGAAHAGERAGAGAAATGASASTGAMGATSAAAEGTSAAGAGEEGALAATGDGGAASPVGEIDLADAAPPTAFAAPSALGRPVRVVALGWAAWAPAMFADYTQNAARVDAFADVVARLAKGGADPEGADVAIAPYPALIGALERLRALEPEAFLVVGWSRGGEAIAGADDASLARSAAQATEAASSGDAAARVEVVASDAEASSTALLFGLAALELSGAPLDGVRVVDAPPPAGSAAAARALVVVEHAGGLARAPEGDRVVASSADASRLVPIVAFAPRAFLEEHPADAATFARAWLGGVDVVRRDRPGAARRVAAVAGAPPPMTMLDALAEVDPASPDDAAAALGVAGRGAVTLEALTPIYWRAARAASLVRGNEPSVPPIRRSVLASALGPSAAAAAPHASAAPAHAAVPGAAPPVLLRRRVGAAIDDDALASEVALLASVYQGRSIRLTVAGGRARSIAAAARERVDAGAAQIVDVAGDPRGAFALVEVLAR